MRLEYNILWVDDDTEGLEDIFDPHLKGFFDELGFIMNLKRAKDETELTQIIENNNNFNLIFMDYHFDNEDKGIVFINKLREKGIFATVFFYSAQTLQELKNLVMQQDIQGLFLYYRPNILRDIEKIKKMIQFDLTKDIDLNAMRGIAMAEVAEIDHYLLDIIKLLEHNNKWEEIEDNSKNARRRQCFKHIDCIKDSEERKRLDDSCKIVNAIRNKDFEKLIIDDPDKSSKFFPSGPRTDFLCGCLTLKDILNEIDKDALVKLKKYKQDVIEIRNKLAHYKTPPEVDYIQLRKNIISHKANIESILEILKEHYSTVQSHT